MKSVFITILVLFMLCTNVMAIEAAAPNTGKSISEFTYYKVGILWDIDGLSYNPSNKNIKDWHIHGKTEDISNYVSAKGINFIKKLNLSFFNLTMVFLVSQEPLE